MRPTREVKLGTPVADKDGRTIVDTLRIVKPRTKELRLAATASKGAAEAMQFHLLALAAGQPPQIIDELEIEDFNAASEALMAVMADPATGER